MVGGEPWLYECNDDNSARFLLGTVGANPLVCVGVNPSTAAPGDLDQTVRKVAGFASRNGFDSWVMLNLYPQRSTDPQGMHLAYDPELKVVNERHIADFIGRRPLTLLAAWGDPIEIRPYLFEMLAGILAVTRATECRWVTLGNFTKAGHPRHPSRPGYATPLLPFDADAYLRAVTARARQAPSARA